MGYECIENEFIDYEFENEEETYENELSVYEINPGIRVNNAYIETPYKASNLWHITGFIDMDYKFFDYSRGYKFFMNNKSFDMHINIPSTIDNSNKESILNCIRLGDLLRLSNRSITIKVQYDYATNSVM